jgi:2-hydroxycyclohexanecarboxyl-CoA dehydrogenase
MADAELSGKVALVTGGGRGIGANIARELTAAGMRTAVAARTREQVEQVAEEIGGLAVTVDVSDERSVAAMIEGTERELGPIDVLVNNAGWDIFKPFLKTSPADWQKLIAINLTGALIMHHAVLPQMVERRSGRVVNIASDAARVGSSGEAVYAACKGGLVAFSKTMAREHARDGITFNVVCPGPTDTQLLGDVITAAGNPEKLKEAFRRSIPLGRIGVPADLPGAICFFASEDAAFITGQVLSVSGGLTMAG